jgi:hypothetical protein
MAIATIQFGSLYNQRNQEQILIEAKQNGRFLLEVNKQLKHTVGQTRKHIAESHMREAVTGIQKILSQGIKGARKTVTKKAASKGLDPVSGKIKISGVSLGAVQYSYHWQQLSPHTIWNKVGEPGSGKFWLDTGGPDRRGRPGLREIAASMRAPKVSMSTSITGLKARRADKKNPDKIDFAVTLEFGKMDFPFDELVRRPLITGDDDAVVSSTLGRLDKENVFFNLEFGATVSDYNDRSGFDVPARPWIRGVSAKVGEQMFYNLINR